MKLLSFVGDEEEAEEEVEFQKKPIYRPEREFVTSVTTDKINVRLPFSRGGEEIEGSPRLRFPAGT